MNNIVARIHVGHKIITEDNVFEVLGSMSIRKNYKYICKDSSGNKVTLDREDVLQAQRDGDAKVSL